MRTVCRTWWDADQITLRLLYNGLVRSHLDFGNIFLNPTSKAILNSINTIQHSALRLFLVCMKSIPIDVLYAECAEIDMDSRRLWLATNIMCKISQSQ